MHGYKEEQTSSSHNRTLCVEGAWSALVVIIPTLEMGNLRPSAVRWLTHGHPAEKWRSRVPNPWRAGSGALTQPLCSTNWRWMPSSRRCDLQAPPVIAPTWPSGSFACPLALLPPCWSDFRVTCVQLTWMTESSGHPVPFWPNTLSTHFLCSLGSITLVHLLPSG